MNETDSSADRREHPRHLGDVTCGWLTACMHDAGVAGDVGSFEPELIGDGVGQMATLHRLRLAYSSGSGPECLVVKFPGVMEANLEIARQFSLFLREVEFYRVAASRTTMTLPEIYACEIDADGGFVLLMEDLGAFDTGDQVVGMGAEHAAVAIDELVKLHAPFWGVADTGEFDFAPRVNAQGQADVMHSIAIACWDAMNATFGDAVPPAMNEVRQRFLDAIPAMHDWLGSGPVTMIHSDFRLDNLMLGNGPEHAVITLDWQGAMRSLGIEDVAFLLSQSMPVELRRASERGLVERYRQGLVAAGIDHYSTPDTAWEDYRKCVLYLWMYAVIISGALDTSNPRARSMMSALISRSAAAISDLDCLSLLPEFE